MSVKAGKRSNRRDKIARANSTVFVATMVSSIIIVFSAMSIRFLWEQKQYNDRVIAGKTSARDQLRVNLVNLGQLSEQYPNFKGQPVHGSEAMLHALPPTYDYTGLASSVALLAQDSGVQFTGSIGEDGSESAIATAPTSTPLEIPLTLHVTGNYSTIRQFVRNLELSIRPFHITAIEYSGTSTNLVATITAKTYYQPARLLEAQKETVQ